MKKPGIGKDARLKLKVENGSKQNLDSDKNMQNIRKIKTSMQYVKGRYFRKEVPQLLLKGKWLELAGFQANTVTKILVENKRITIEL